LIEKGYLPELAENCKIVGPRSSLVKIPPQTWHNNNSNDIEREKKKKDGKPQQCYHRLELLI
jgi:hypothetical protein